MIYTKDIRPNLSLRCRGILNGTAAWLCFVLVALALSVQDAGAKLNFKPGVKYYIASAKLGGSVTLGAPNKQKAPLIYRLGQVNDDGYWYIEERAEGLYTLQSALTGEYIKFDSISLSYHRYVGVYDLGDGYDFGQDSSALWRIEAHGDQGLSFTSAVATNHHLNLDVTNYYVGTTAFLPTTSYKETNLWRVFDEAGDPVLKGELGNAASYLDRLKLGGVSPVFDRRGPRLLLPVSQSKMRSTNVTLPVELASEEGYTARIDGMALKDGGTVTLKQPQAGKEFLLEVFADTGRITSTSLYVTFMPVVELNSGVNSSNFAPGSIRVTDADYFENNDSLYKMTIRYRGASNGWKTKHAFALKLCDKRGENIDRSFHGLRSDNYWVLDAMAVDVARMRNPSSFALWNSYATPQWYAADQKKAQVGSRCFMVEVVLNGEYHGIYNMMEREDRKQFQLKKLKEDGTIRGVLYKCMSWGYSARMGYDNGMPGWSQSGYSNSRDTWGAWEFKYPQLEDGEPIDWAPLYDAINMVTTANNRNAFLSQLEKRFDLPMWVDLYLLVELIQGYDNVGKNLYYYSYDVSQDLRMCVAPWDMDGTWGREWDSSIGYNQTASRDISGTMRQFGLFYREEQYNSDNWKKTRAKRYCDLRGTQWREDVIKKIFRDNFTLFRLSGADTRERKKWSGSGGITLNFEKEEDYLMTWIHDRLAQMDKQYGYTVPAGITTAADAATSLVVYGGLGELRITASEAQTVAVHTMSGQLIRQVDVEPGTNRYSLPKGIYIVARQKVMVK